jgi:two-component system chemotaxis response regulator CheY
MNRTIMTVDDSRSIRQMVKFTLSQAGHDVIEAVDGKDGLAKLEENNIDMVITDLHMPAMDGIQLIREIRARERYKYIPIIMLTTESQENRKLEGKAMGATGWIVKPFLPEQLLAVVKKVLR